MHTAIKTSGKRVQAWCLGQDTPMEQQLLAQGLLRKTDRGYEVFSQEARDGCGEAAVAGDYIKLDPDGYPYPNDRAFFLAHHRQLQADTYEQLPAPLQVWFSTDPICPEVQYLQTHKQLRLSPETPDRYFEAPLWGTVLTADHRAALIFYSIDRDAGGAITDASFNFVTRDVFEQTYTLLPAENSI